MEQWQRDLDRWLTSDPRDDVDAVAECALCGEDIYEGETIYKIKNNIFCARCIEESRTEAE